MVDFVSESGMTFHTVTGCVSCGRDWMACVKADSHGRPMQGTYRGSYPSKCPTCSKSRPCAICGKTFERSHAASKLCSDECRRMQSVRTRQIRLGDTSHEDKCAVCGIAFMRSATNQNCVCGVSCGKALARLMAEMANCKTCGRTLKASVITDGECSRCRKKHRRSREIAESRDDDRLSAMMYKGGMTGEIGEMQFDFRCMVMAIPNFRPCIEKMPCVDRVVLVDGAWRAVQIKTTDSRNGTHVSLGREDKPLLWDGLDYVAAVDRATGDVFLIPMSDEIREKKTLSLSWAEQYRW